MQENEKVRKNTGGDNGFTFEIVEHICVLGKGREEGYTKELNYVSFRGLPPKWDVREWNSDHTRMTKGITFTWDEMRKLIEERTGAGPDNMMYTLNPKVDDIPDTYSKTYGGIKRSCC